jgi:hypothetical protein
MDLPSSPWPLPNWALQKESAAAVNSALMIDPGYDDHLAADLKARNVDPDLIPTVVDGLHKGCIKCAPSCFNVDTIDRRV